MSEQRCDVCYTYIDSPRTKDCPHSDCPLRRRQYQQDSPQPLRDSLLVEREKTHGSFQTNALISQQIKHCFHTYGKYPTENPVYCEALDMIALKLSRILSGQSNYADHWDDIAGYAKLARKACK